jgi:hypothetical protein
VGAVPVAGFKRASAVQLLVAITKLRASPAACWWTSRSLAACPPTRLRGNISEGGFRPATERFRIAWEVSTFHATAVADVSQTTTMPPLVLTRCTLRRLYLRRQLYLKIEQLLR